MDTPADLVVTGTTVHTLDPQTPTAVAVGSGIGPVNYCGSKDWQGEPEKSMS